MAFEPKPTRRTQLYRDPRGLFVHDLILEACHRFGEKTAIIDHSTTPQRSLSYAEYGSLVERLELRISERSYSPRQSGRQGPLAMPARRSPASHFQAAPPVSLRV